jgi:hypothetical protein
VISLADILSKHGAEYLSRYENNMLPSHKKVMREILLCRSGHLGWHEWYCQDCNKVHYAYNSCRNRHCPKCQNNKTQKWIIRQQERLLPVEYFLFTFTIPQDLRSLARSNQKIFYNILFHVSSQCLQLLARDKRFMGGETGMVGVLHTWSQTMEYHPHVHYIIPGISILPKNQILRLAHQGFLVHVKALSRLYRFRFKKALEKAGLLTNVSSNIFGKEWVVHGKSVGSGLSAIKYLAQYVYRIAISNQRIISCKNGRVTLCYKDHDSDNYRIMSLNALEFMRRFFQHILPKGFQKVRYFGFMHPKRYMFFNQVRLLLMAKFIISKNCFKEKVVMLCPDCGRPMVCIASKTVSRAPPLNELLNRLITA